MLPVAFEKVPTGHGAHNVSDVRVAPAHQPSTVRPEFVSNTQACSPAISPKPCNPEQRRIALHANARWAVDDTLSNTLFSWPTWRSVADFSVADWRGRSTANFVPQSHSCWLFFHTTSIIQSPANRTAIPAWRSDRTPFYSATVWPLTCVAVSKGMLQAYVTAKAVRLQHAGPAHICPLLPHNSTSDACADQNFGPSLPVLPYDPGEQGGPPLQVVAPAR